VPELLVATFYRFIRLERHAALKAPLEACCEANEVRGTILLASEGLNATIAGTRRGVMAVLEHLARDERLADLTWRESRAEVPPFRRMRIRLKREIVTMGVPDIDPARLAGTYVKPADWNALIDDPGVIVIDTRNDYEVTLGTFKNAIDPEIAAFRELPKWLEARIDPARRPRVAMFCTGGIRCEKSTALLKQAGVHEVFHLEGGILRYLEEIPAEESLWEGQCFVFDERVSVGPGLEVGGLELCRACGWAIEAEGRRSPRYRAGVSCHRCKGNTTPDQKRRFAERQRQFEASRNPTNASPAPPDGGTLEAR